MTIDELHSHSEENNRESQSSEADVETQLGDFTPPLESTLIPPSEPEVRSQIGPYRILQSIGHGGMGQVFMAEQTEPVKRRVALKVIRTDTPTKEVLARFEAERQAVAMMDHQNIARILDAGSTESGQPWFAMELVQGLPITEYCDSQRLTPDERLELFVQTCRAIQHAHIRGVLHRDIKPSNVLVALYDGEPVVKVIDFGLAKALQDTTTLTDRTLFTQYGQVVGTLAYMSPEQAEMNTLNVDARTDVYSLGVILYELLAGSTPIARERIRSEAFDRILAMIREEETPPPSQRLTDSGDRITGISEQRRTEPRRLKVTLKGNLDLIAIKALEKDRTRRYDTPGALADDIERHLSGLPITAHPLPFRQRISKRISYSIRSNPMGWLAALTGVILVQFVLVNLVNQFSPETAEWLVSTRSTLWKAFSIGGCVGMVRAFNHLRRNPSDDYAAAFLKFVLVYGLVAIGLATILSFVHRNLFENVMESVEDVPTPRFDERPSLRSAPGP